MRAFFSKTDEELMSLVAGGELDAVAVLFEKYHRPLFGFFVNMGKDQAYSADLVQNVFERVIKYRQSYQPALSFRIWLYQIARNVFADDFSRHRPEFHADLTKLNGFDHSEPDPVSTEAALVQLEKALLHLPPEHREVLLLTRIQQLKYAEVGLLLGCTENAVKVRVFRAMEKLRLVYFKMEQL